MFRLALRVLLVVYFVLPIAASFLVVQTFAQIHSDVAPVYEAASASITRATSALDHELRNLGANFAPLATAINGIRNALQVVLNFIRDTIYTLIDVVNGINLACSVGGAACIPKSINVTLPTLVDLSFMNDISNHISTISTQVNSVIDTTTTALTSYTTLLALAAIVFVVWIVLTYILFFVFLYTGLWRRT